MASAHRVRTDLSLVDPNRLSTTNAEVLDEIDEFGIHYLCDIATDGNTRVIPDPEQVGQLVVVNLNDSDDTPATDTLDITTQGSGTFYGAGLSATWGVDDSGTTLTLTGSGATAVLLAIQKEGTLAWAVIGSFNATVA